MCKGKFALRIFAGNTFTNYEQGGISENNS
jgi:hypothetical protein